jgi:hypothetical protein
VNLRTSRYVHRGQLAAAMPDTATTVVTGLSGNERSPPSELIRIPHEHAISPGPHDGTAERMSDTLSAT